MRSLRLVVTILVDVEVGGFLITNTTLTFNDFLTKYLDTNNCKTLTVMNIQYTLLDICTQWVKRPVLYLIAKIRFQQDDNCSFLIKW